MKKRITAVGLGVSSLLVIASFTYIYFDRTFINFTYNNECIVVKDDLDYIVKSGLEEFPNCHIVKRGTYSGGNYIYVECASGHVVASSYAAFDNHNTCNKYANLGSAEKNGLLDGK